MGDIMADEGKTEQATEYYREAAALFLKQKDLRNELHAREGLYRVTKQALPAEALLHLERAKVLQDSIYRQETGEALGKYNAIYYNDILQEKQQQAEHQKKVILATSLITAVLLLVIIGIAVIAVWRFHKRKETDYKQDIALLKGRYDEVNRHYRNLVTTKTEQAESLTEDDKAFLAELVNTIDTETEKGTISVDNITRRMHISTATLRRRLSQTMSMTPQAYIMQVRMQKAKYLLESYRDITITEVAERCGYTQMSNFTRAFIRYYGITPSEAKPSQAADIKKSESQTDTQT
jgi:AraC-like DNA-binding protein